MSVNPEPSDRPRYIPYEDSGTISRFVPVFALGFGALVGVMLLYISGLRGLLILIPFFCLIGFFEAFRRFRRYQSIRRNLYANGIEVSGIIRSISADGYMSVMEIETTTDQNTVLYREQVSAGLAEQYKLGATIRLLVDPHNRSQFALFPLIPPRII